MEKELDHSLEKNKELEANISDIAVCIQHLAASMTTFALQGVRSASVEDPLDSLLLKDDDDDKGYLH